jgi:NO-binding membrane sensor protein with MHYT domain
LSEEERWKPKERPTSRASEPPDLKFNPLATGIAIFTAIAIPLFVLGYTQRKGPNHLIIVAGVVAGLIAGIAAGVWVARRHGDVYRGPQL